MSTHGRSEAVDALLEAYRSGEPIEPLTQRFPGLDVHDAYAIQLGQVERWHHCGAAIKGHKVGLSAAPMQRQLGVDHPDYGHLTDAMFHLEAQPIDVATCPKPNRNSRSCSASPYGGRESPWRRKGGAQ